METIEKQFVKLVEQATSPAIKNQFLAILAETLSKKPALVGAGLIERLSKTAETDLDSGVREAALLPLAVIAEQRPELITNELIASVKKIAADPDGYVRESALQTLGTILKKRPERITKELITYVRKIALTDPKVYDREAAQQTLGAIVRQHSDLVDTVLIKSVTQTAVIDRERAVRQASLRTLAVIAEQRPKLVDTAIEPDKSLRSLKTPSLKKLSSARL